MAGRYATALFELALESNAVGQVQSDLKAFDGLVAANPDLARLVRSPVFSADEQAKALIAILERAGIKVKLGSRMIDASLKTKLNAIKLAMKEAR